MVNLASLIMEGSNFGSSSVDLGNYDYSDSVIAETSYMDSALATLFTDIMEAEQSFMVADVVGAATVIRESKLGNNIDIVAVTEGVFTDTLEKIKNGFKKFIAKIKEFYHKVINWFKAMFSSAENFVNNFGDVIRKKEKKGFKYSGYKYNMEGGKNKVETLQGDISKKINELVGGFDVVKEPKSNAEFKDIIANKLSGSFKTDDVQTKDDIIEKFLSDHKYSDYDNMRQDIIKIYHGGDTEKGTINNFEANSVDEMLTFLKSSKSVISKLNEDLKNYDTKVRSVISQLNKLDKLDDDSDKNTAMMSNATYLAGVVTGFLNLYKIPSNIQININKEVARVWLGVLKKFYNYRPAKESTMIFDPESYATLENSILFESDDDDDDEDGDKKSGKGGNDTKECTESAIDSILSIAANFSF